MLVWIELSYFEAFWTKSFRKVYFSENEKNCQKWTNWRSGVKLRNSFQFRGHIRFLRYKLPQEKNLCVSDTFEIFVNFEIFEIFNGNFDQKQKIMPFFRDFCSKCEQKLFFFFKFSVFESPFLKIYPNFNIFVRFLKSA